MFDLRILRDQPTIKFDRQLPVFNWPHPFSRLESCVDDGRHIYADRHEALVRRRAVYLHVPFCETICNFCPFGRERYTSAATVEKYVDALVQEISLKQRFIGRCEVDAIAVGGGTPSLLAPDQIARIGTALAQAFDLGRLREFTFEAEVKSVSQQKLQAMRDIGVNRVSFGVQTFSDRYRELFSLDAHARQVRAAAAMITSMFDHTNADLLYGMAGQELGELDDDIAAITELGTTTLDVYPINNLSATSAMHRAIRRAGLGYLPEAARVRFRMHAEERLRGLGYSPISGYGFARTDSRADVAGPVQETPTFLYHDLVYGHEDDEIIGYGSSAMSRSPGVSLCNIDNRRAYVETVIGKKSLPHDRIGRCRSPERGVVTFPFRGELDKARVPWHQVPDETLNALREAIDADLVTDEGERYVLTRHGWLFYVNLMFHLMPASGKQLISQKMEEMEHGGRLTGITDLTNLMVPTEVATR
ncbi:hypothetical protein DP939_04530 [Spongiactinospora rosea]|uniref:Heme chaperone HemW n=1 Tax=Spongiactinospora rosea TaxID=2248750 RepID=A0A366M7Y4_9ACTN|nr:radical SAM protein [Spongiactinospora rosea]RBQ21943.1 hypothetical protein DP939_04530 [Spongiactinospora rosea]